MCGIAGILNLKDASPPEESLVRAMLGTLRHRGPDEFGIYLGDRVALGNARLSIIDLGGGQQPISNEDQTLWIVFNGEIFNYRELRQELEARGHRFATQCDTEVIVHLYEDGGPECLSRLNGQWAIAIWDERKRALFLARDRLGVRPLFYTESNGLLRFGSEIKAIFADPRVARALDPVGLDQVFTFWSAQPPRTCFAGIRELPPGHFLIAREGTMSVQRYWGLEFADLVSSPAGPDEAEAVEGLRELLTDAVKIRLRADVPVGAYLSGGLDSSTIAAIIRRLGVGKLDTFSIAFSDPQFDESEHQRAMARFLGTAHQVVQATHEEIGQVFPEVVWHAETALMRTAPAPMFLLSKLVRQHSYKVVLTGEGADEFLAGYDIFKETKIRRFWARQPHSRWRPRLLQRLYPDIRDLSAAGAAYLQSFFGWRLSEIGDPGYSHAIRWKNTRRCTRLFSEELQRRVGGAGKELGEVVLLPKAFASWGALERAQFVEASTFLSTYLLSSQGDRMGMAHSVEGRFPFLDHRVVDFCSRLPSRLKLRVLRDKHILREMARPLIPPDILQRPKRPYRAPIHRSFLNTQCRPWVREILDEPALAEAGLFRPQAVTQLLAKAEQGNPLGETDNMALVGIISAQLLHRQFVRAPRVTSIGGSDHVKVVDRRISPQTRGS